MTMRCFGTARAALEVSLPPSAGSASAALEFVQPPVLRAVPLWVVVRHQGCGLLCVRQIAIPVLDRRALWANV